MRFSICIIAYNAERWIEACLNSCIKQTYIPHEIIISDDCSSDNSRDIIDKFILAHPDKVSWKFFRQEKNLGISKNTKFVCNQATGDLIFMIAGDDLIMPDFLMSFKELLSADMNLKKLFFMSSTQFAISSEGVHLKLNPYPQSKTFFKNALRKNGSFIKCGVSRHILVNASYPNNLGIWADWAWDVGIAANNPNIRIIVNNKPGYVHRQGSGVSASEAGDEIDRSYLRVAEYIWQEFRLKMDFFDVLYILGEIYFIKGKVENSFAYKIIGFIFFLVNTLQCYTLVSLKSSAARYIPNYFLKKINVT